VLSVPELSTMDASGENLKLRADALAR